MNIFSEDYAGIYDSLYSGQDFKAEANGILSLAQANLSKSRPSLLDLGCGTGNHSVLFQDHFDVMGADQSENMLKLARKKCPELKFVQGDARTIDLQQKFDIIAMMSAVLGYQQSNEHVLETMRNVRGHLDVGGLFVFDVWYGPAILAEKMVQRLREYDANGVRLMRLMTPTLNSYRNLCTCHYKWWVPSGGALITREEYHTQRYFFMPEVQMMLEATGFSLLRVAKPGYPQRPIEETDRDVMFVAQAR